MRCHLLATVLFTAVLTAQTTVDIGLTIDSGALTVMYGQICGPVACQPLPGPTIVAGTTRTLGQNAAPWTPFAIAVGLPMSGCTPVAGIANALLLGPPIIIFAVGVTGPPVPTIFGGCPRGVASVSLTVPPGAPSGLVFVLQSVGVDWSGQLGFSDGIAAVLQ